MTLMSGDWPTRKNCSETAIKSLQVLNPAQHSRAIGVAFSEGGEPLVEHGAVACLPISVAEVLKLSSHLIIDRQRPLIHELAKPGPCGFCATQDGGKMLLAHSRA